MNGLLQKTLLVLMFVDGLTCHPQVSVQCKSASITLCGSQQTTINEVPSGLVNGTNVVFNLSRDPMNPLEVTVFVNEQIMSRALDFSIHGKRLSFNGAAAPQAGDAVSVRYVTRSNDPYEVPSSSEPGGSRSILYSGSAAENPAQARALPVTIPVTQADAVLRRTILRSVEQERAQYSIGEKNKVVPMGAVGSTRREPRSLRMLASTISAKQQKERVVHSNDHGSLTSAEEGVDGTGDTPQSSSYSLLLGMNPSRGELDMLVENDDRRVDSRKGSSIAMRMLEQKLSGSEVGSPLSREAR